MLRNPGYDSITDYKKTIEHENECINIHSPLVLFPEIDTWIIIVRKHAIYL